MKTMEVQHKPVILFFYGGSYVYGKEKSILPLMKGLKERGYTVHNVSNGWNDGVFNSLLRETGIPYTEIKLGKISKTWSPRYLWWTLNACIHLPGAWWKFRRLLKRLKPDVIAFESYYQLFFLKGLLKKNQRILVTNHEEPEANYFFSTVMRSRLSSRIHHIGVSRFICNKLLQLGVAPNKVHLLYNSLESLPAKSPPKASSESMVIGCAGQIGPWKGQEDLIEALGMLKSSFTCLIAGTGDAEYVEFLKAKCRQLGLNKMVQWLGYVNDMNSFYQSIDICIVPSRINEAFGRIPVEAGVWRVPSIVTDCGGLPEIVRNGETGFIVPSHSPDALAEKILLLSEHPDLIPKLGEAAYQDYKERFSSKRQLDEFEHILEIAHTDMD